MKKYRKVLRIMAAIILGLLAALPAARPQPAAAIDEDVVDRVYPAVVQLGPIIEFTDEQGEKTIRFLGWGSGTIVHSDGYILTNHHVTDLSDLLAQVEGRPDVRIIEGMLAVFMTLDTDNPPTPTYIAEVRVDAPSLDLAVLKITQDLGGRDLTNQELGLPTVALGDSSKLKLGQKVHIFGYPAIGGETITFTSGDISGFTYEAGVEGRAWIKTSASISGGNSGGTGVDDKGNLIGVPTRGGSGAGGDIVDCRPVTDTNGDGKLDDQDTCVPVGGFINALRPVDLAKPLINQAIKGIEPPPTSTAEPSSPTPERTPGTPGTPGTPKVTETPGTPEVTETPGTPGTPGTETPGTPEVTETPGGTETPATPSVTVEPREPKVSRMIVGNGISENGYPVSVVESLPSGAANIVCYFDYSGFQDGVMWQMRAFVNGVEEEGAWPASMWDESMGGTDGTWWFGWLEAEDLPDGTYKFQVEYDGKVMGETSIEVGGADEPKPMFSNATLSAGDVTDIVLPAGGDKLTANAEATNMQGGEKWQATWYQRPFSGGDWQQVFQSEEETWSGGAEGTVTADYEAPAPLDEGVYRVELTIDGKLSATTDAWIFGAVEPGSESFGPIVFSESVEEDGTPKDPATEFPEGTFEIHATWEYTGMQNDLNWNLQWLLDDLVVVDQDQQWEGGESGMWSSYLYMPDGSPLPVGKYEIRLSIEGTQVQTATATIGDLANRPTPTPTPDIEGSILIEGTVLDAITLEPIPNASFVVLQEGITWDQFQDKQEQILEIATTDANGEFKLKTPLPRGKAFSLGVFAEGYQSTVVDNAEITADLPSVVRLTIHLEKLP